MWKRQYPCIDDKSRMMGDYHVRFREKLRVKLPWFTRPKWECKYHLVFAPKYRRQIVYGKLKQDVANIQSMLCKRKGIEIIEAECCKDHIHMLVRIPPKYSVSSIMGYFEREKLVNDI